MMTDDNHLRKTPKIRQWFLQINSYLQEGFRQIRSYLPEGFWQISSYLPEGFRQITSSYYLTTNCAVYEVTDDLTCLN